MPKSKKIHKEYVENEDIEENLRIKRKPKRKKRYPGGKIFAPELISDDLIAFIHEQDFISSIFTEDDVRDEWNAFLEGAV